MAAADSPAHVELSRLLARDYWLILSTPLAACDQAAVNEHVEDHVAWLLDLERDSTLLASGPLVSGPGVGPGSGVTVLRAADEDAVLSPSAIPSCWPGSGRSRCTGGVSTKAASPYACPWAPAPTSGSDGPGFGR
jgi:uncharacterized protein YciI